MSEGGASARLRRGLAPRAEAAVGHWVGRYAAALAVLGGLVLTGVTVVSVVSILGRWLRRTGWEAFSRLGPIQGDFEIVSVGVGFAVFACLAWCQYARGHVTVDIFVTPLGPRGKAALATLTNLILAGAAALLAWQTGIGMQDKMRFGETTTILRLPVWWGYAGGAAGLWSFALVALYTAWRSLNEALDAGEPADPAA
jgi:hypothetical protein